MATFNFPYHTLQTKYPESGTRVKLGNSYMFAVGPSAPDQRIFLLGFETMRYATNTDGSIDRTWMPELNAAVLEDFYITHKLWSTFEYTHPVHGLLDVKFNRPLQLPKGKKGGDGWLESFEIELIEQP